jgi:hypothetical protein
MAYFSGRMLATRALILALALIAAATVPGAEITHREGLVMVPPSGDRAILIAEPARRRATE